MHRSRLSVLVIFAAMAACSKQDDSEGSKILSTDILSQDRTLVQRLEVDQESRQLPLPAACGTVRLPHRPTSENLQKAEELARQARVAGIQGDEKEAGALLRRAFELDGTSKTTVYNLARTSEAVGDRAMAKTAYCRFLALKPTTAESAEARERVAKLSQAETQVAAGSVSESTPARRRLRAAPARRVTNQRPAVEPRVVARTAVPQSVSETSSERDTQPASPAASGGDVSPAPSEQVTTSPAVDETASSTVAEGEVSSTPRPVPVDVDQPATASRKEGRVMGRPQGAGIGAAAGAIIGAVAGRSVKSAIIGAAAGGILGTMSGRTIVPAGRGIRP